MVEYEQVHALDEQLEEIQTILNQIAHGVQFARERFYVALNVRGLMEAQATAEAAA